LAPSSSRPSPPATAFKRPTNHATEYPASEDHATPHQIEPFRSTEADPPRFPVIPPARTKDQRRSARGFLGFRRRKRERRERERESARGESEGRVGHCRSRLLEVFRADCGVVGEYGTALARPHTSVGGAMSHADMAHGTTLNGMILPQTRRHPACTTKWHEFKRSIISNV
jgi:hypothetical protein